MLKIRNQKILRLFKASIFISAGQAFLAAFQWVFLLLLIKQYNPLIAGNFSLLLAVVSPIYLFFDFNLRVARSTERSRYDSIEPYLYIRLFGFFASSSICYLLAKIYFPSILHLILVGIVLKSLESISGLAYGQYQREGRAWLVGFSLLLRAVGFFVTLCVAYFIEVDSTHLFVILCVTLFICTLFDMRSLYVEYAKRFVACPLPSQGWIRPSFGLAVLCLPLAFDALVSSLTLNVGRYVISDSLGLDSVAVYSLVFQGAFVFQILIGSVGHASVGSLSDLYQKRRLNEFYSEFWILMKMCLWASIIFIIAMLGFKPLFFSLIGIDSLDHELFFILMILASVVAAIQRMFGRALQSIGGYRRYLLVDVVLFIVVAVSTLYTVPRHGLFGASGSLLFGFSVALLLTCALCHRVVTNSNSTVV